LRGWLTQRFSGLQQTPPSLRSVGAAEAWYVERADMAIRAAVATDVDGIMAVQSSAVLRICSSVYKPDEIAAWTAGCNDPERYLPGILEGRFSVALIEGSVVGFYDLDVGRAELRGLFVEAGLGRRGIGRALLKHAELSAVRQGVQRLRLDSTVNAITFYEAHGFVLDEMGMFELRSGLRLPCGIMHKDLDLVLATLEPSPLRGVTE
jgi:GNAT superfamily N-acetyltransferase